ncbi:unnamed protein product [Caenorhabditis angaria]|uniref:FBXO47 ARM repeats region domain-containing protein n=1 Tax=Caenorhabditis angaria TaxID=860376 RepID=A0A9P1ICH8_9PELO|nr:unnamed protein product [Caenorhabditis angaria]
METPTTPSSHRNENSFRRNTRNLATNISNKLTSFFGVRKRYSENSSLPTATKRRRSYVDDGVKVKSPVSVVSSPDGRNISPLLMRARGFPLRPISFEEPTPFGSFENLPIDVVNFFLDTLKYSHLGSLSVTSKDWMKNIQLYVNSLVFEKKWVKEMLAFDNKSPEKYTEMDPFYGMGVLVRKLTSSEKSFENRLSVFQQYLKVARLHTKSTEGCGRMIHGFMKDHSSMTPQQYSLFFQVVFNVFHGVKWQLEVILDVVDETYRKPAGPFFSLPKMIHEMNVRKTIKNLFLSNMDTDPNSESNRCFLSFFLNEFKHKGMSKLSKLMYLLFAPTIRIRHHEIIHWSRFSELVVTTEDEAQSVLKPMANALRALMECKRSSAEKPWMKNSIFNLMEEMTTYPEPWSMNTFVSLLLMQPCLIPISIVARMQKDHEQEAGDMLCTMKLLLHRWGNNVEEYLSLPFKSIVESLPVNQLRQLHDCIWMWHQTNINELRERYDTFSDISAEYQSQIALLPLLQTLITVPQ